MSKSKHRNHRIEFDDDREEYKDRKQAGKKGHSRHIPVQEDPLEDLEDDPRYEEIKRLLK